MPLFQKWRKLILALCVFDLSYPIQPTLIQCLWGSRIGPVKSEFPKCYSIIWFGVILPLFRRVILIVVLLKGEYFSQVCVNHVIYHVFAKGDLAIIRYPSLLTHLNIVRWPPTCLNVGTKQSLFILSFGFLLT